MRQRAEVLNRILEEREAGIKIEYQRVWRNNLEKEAYVIRGEMGYAAPVMYRGAWYEKANEEVVDFLIRAYNEYAVMVDTQGFTDPESVKKNVLPRVSSADNKEMMDRADICCLEAVEGLLTSFYLPVFLANEQEGCLQITNALLTTLSITPEEAFAAALKNMSASISIMSMDEMLAEVAGIDMGEDPVGAPPLTVVTNTERQLGAAAILCPELYEMLRTRLGHDNLIVLPSSIHEVLVTEVAEDADISAFTDMVREVNDTQVAPEDRLSYNVFGWPEKDGVLKALA